MRLLKKRKTVFVAMSGGVDSSVTAFLLQQKRYEIVGVFMKNWSESIPGILHCSTEEDQRYARTVASQLNIPFYSWDFETEYRRLVFDPMVRAYAEGYTPNPDVSCNGQIKFGLFYEKAMRLGADMIATGHYVRLRRRMISGEFVLKMALDKQKDQSYFLWMLSQSVLNRCLFPVGEFTKPMVRRIARRACLESAEKKDSQGLCFVGHLNFSEFLSGRISDRPGPVIVVEPVAPGGYAAKEIGSHNGLHLFTLGQRHGIGIGGGIPYYVIGKDYATARLFISRDEYAAEFFPKTVPLSNFHSISGKSIAPKFKVGVRYRYRQRLVFASIKGDPSTGYKAVFDRPPQAITPGQSLVWYRGQTMLGGAIIARFSQDWMNRIVI